jgi:hypothetical protein
VYTAPQGQIAHLNRSDKGDAISGDLQSVGPGSKRPVQSNWREEDILTVVNGAGKRDRSLEDEFKKTEGKALDQIRRITPTRITDEQRQALDLLAAEVLCSADEKSIALTAG